MKNVTKFYERFRLRMNVERAAKTNAENSPRVAPMPSDAQPRAAVKPAMITAKPIDFNLFGRFDLLIRYPRIAPPKRPLKAQNRTSKLL